MHPSDSSVFHLCLQPDYTSAGLFSQIGNSVWRECELVAPSDQDLAGSLTLQLKCNLAVLDNQMTPLLYFISACNLVTQARPACLLGRSSRLLGQGSILHHVWKLEILPVSFYNFSILQIDFVYILHIAQTHLKWFVPSWVLYVLQFTSIYWHYNTLRDFSAWIINCLDWLAQCQYVIDVWRQPISIHVTSTDEDTKDMAT